MVITPDKSCTKCRPGKKHDRLYQLPDGKWECNYCHTIYDDLSMFKNSKRRKQEGNRRLKSPRKPR